MHELLIDASNELAEEAILVPGLLQADLAKLSVNLQSK